MRESFTQKSPGKINTEGSCNVLLRTPGINKNNKNWNKSPTPFKKNCECSG